MNNVTPLPSRRERTALGNREELVRRSREESAAFGQDLDFDALAWDITKHCPRPSGKAGQKVILYFANHDNGTSKGVEERIPLNEPFGSVIKAIVRLKKENAPKVGEGPLSILVRASRFLEPLLANRGYDPCLLVPADFDEACEAVKQRIQSPDSRYRLGVALENLSEALARHHVTQFAFRWKNTFTRPDASVRVGAQADIVAELRDVVLQVLSRLAIELLLDPDDELFINNPGLIRTLYDPTCGTGGFLADGMEHIQSLRDRYSIAPVVVPHGQELEPETHAVCLAGMLLKTLESDPGRDLSQNIKLGSTLSNDQYANERFHYCISNPPFGKKWEKDQAAVVREHQEKKFEGRFGPKLPRVSDGSMLFLLHLVSKLEAPERGGGRAAIVLSGSPLFNGNAGQGESEIRRFLLENDYVEAIIALPTEIFFRTGIGTYIWILSNKKPAARKGKVQLIDASALYTPMRKSEGNKKRMISGDQTRQIVDVYSAFEETETSKIFHYEEFGYRRVKVLRPLRMKIVISEEGFASLDDDKAWNKLSDAQKEAWTSTLVAHVGREHEYEWLEPFVKAASKKNAALGKADKALIKAFVGAFGVRDPDAEPVRDGKGNIVPDDGLTDFENVPLGTYIEDYMESEVLPWADDAYVDQTYRDDDDNEVGIVGYEINFNRYFYQFSKTRSLPEVDIELKKLTSRISEKMVSILDSDNEKFSKHYSATVGERDTWLGAVPADWSLEKIKYSFQEKIPEKNTDVPPGAISYGRVVKKSTEKLTDETQETYQRIAPGEFLINPINLNYDLVSLRTALSTIDVKVSPAYIVLKHDEQKIYPKFAEYLLNVFDVKHMKTLGAGVRQTITFKDIGNVK